MADARTLLPARSDSVGPVYLAGYAIECSLKALLQRRGHRFPRPDIKGHDLRHLWKKSDLSLNDIPRSYGIEAYYLESWSTDLRYVVGVEFPGSCEDMVAGAGALVDYLQKKLRR